MEEELISVIIPVYNTEKYLPRCLDCLARQSYRNLEIILVDDGSTDSSGRICDEYAERDSRARVIHQSNQGLWSARNTGQSASKGEYLIFPDADDYFHPDYITLLYKAITWRGIEWPMALCGIKETTAINESFSDFNDPGITVLSQRQLIRGLLGDNSTLYGAQWNKLYRRTAALFPINRNYLRNQDGDSNLRFYHTIDKVPYVDAPLYFYFRHPGQLTQTPDYWEIRLKADIKMISSAREEFSNINRAHDDLLLYRLYTRMILLKGRNWGKTDYEEVSLLSDTIDHRSRKALYSCKGIDFLKKRLLVVLFLNAWVTHFVLRISNNL